MVFTNKSISTETLHRFFETINHRYAKYLFQGRKEKCRKNSGSVIYI